MLRRSIRERQGRSISALLSFGTAISLALMILFAGYGTSQRAEAAPVAAAFMTSGNGQSQLTYSILAEPFVITVVDATGAATAEVAVSWSITMIPPGASGQSLSETTTITDSNGQASSVLTLGDLPGRYEVTAVVTDLEGSPVTFFAIASASSKPMLLSPSNGEKLANMGTTLRWSYPVGSTQYELRVVPFNSDGPGIHLIRNIENSYTILAPDFGGADPNYVMLPGMTYSWQVRTTTVMGVPEEGDWTEWAARTFITPSVNSSTITLHHPTQNGVVDSLRPTLTWSNSNPEVFYYEVQVSKDMSFNTDRLTATAMVYWELRHGGLTNPLNSYLIPADFPLEPNTLYHWRVRPRIQGDGSAVVWTASSSFMSPTS